MKKSLIIYLIILLSILFWSGAVWAKAVDLQVPIPIPGGGLEKQVENLGQYISLFYQFFVTSAGILATVMIVFGGYRWITAAGNANKIGEAKETIISAILGLILALTSYILLNTINPAITSLKPLTVPALTQFSAEGMAKRLCNFDAELDESTNEPVRCGRIIFINPRDPENDEQCLGVRSLDNDNYCKVTQLGDLLAGIEADKTTIANHPSNQQIFDVNNDEACGDVWYDTPHYEVGMECSKLGGYNLRCRLEGETGIFVSNPSVCSGVRWNPEILAGCGKLSNMKCQNGED